ncbi:MAG: hypothetical protein OSJ36_05170 [Odoribacter sp.]|nr:hypothetical protein [Odoribacter sp.]
MTLLSDKEALYEKYRKETERLRKEILAEKSVMLKSMVHKTYYCKDNDTYFFISHIAENKTAPFGLSISRSEITNDWMVNPEKWIEIPVGTFFNAMDTFVAKKKKDIQNSR